MGAFLDVYAEPNTEKYIEFTASAYEFLLNDSSLVPSTTFDFIINDVLTPVEYEPVRRESSVSSFLLFDSGFNHGQDAPGKTLSIGFVDENDAPQYTRSISYAEEIPGLTPGTTSARPYSVTESLIFVELVNNIYHVNSSLVSNIDLSSFDIHPQEQVSNSVGRLVDAILFGSSFEEYVAYAETNPITVSGLTISPAIADKATFEAYRRFLVDNQVE